MTKNEKISLIIIISLATVIIAGGVYFWWQSRSIEVENVTTRLTEKVDDLIAPNSAVASNFATYKEYDVKISPAVPEYAVMSDLSNITNLSHFEYLDPAAIDLLKKNNFVVTAGSENEFFSLYETNRYDFTPSFITTDAVLHNYHLLFDDLLKKVEERKLIKAAEDLTGMLLNDSLSQYKKYKGTDWEQAARRNLAFFSVAEKLLDDRAKIDSSVKDEVNAELALIEAREGIMISEVINIGQNKNSDEAYKEDYSQYVARGHYTKSEELKKYFKAMMWYGRINWRLKMPEETKSAILMTASLSSSRQAYANWESIYEPVNFFVGQTDDLNYYDYDWIYDQVFSGNDLTAAGQLDKFIELAKKLNKPKINSMPIYDETVTPDRDEAIQGWRLMGQRYTVDAEVFQHLIYREVDDRYLPKALDIPAAFGSELAYDQLRSQGEFQYGNYQKNLDKLRQYVSGLGTDVWTQNLYWGWLYGLNDLLEAPGKGYPSFMTNKAWQYKDLQTFLGSWTELKHDTILYAKQVYAELGGGPEDEGDDRGYVEPRPYVYARLASLVKMTAEGLTARDLIDEKDVALLEKFETLVLRLKEISEKELNGQSLSTQDFEFIKFFGGDLEHLWLEVHADEGATDRFQTADNPAALVADVATDPNGRVLEEAIGFVDNIYVVFPLDGKLKIGKGGVFSHYEFTQPISERLTDEAWYEKLQSYDLPARADWHKFFFAE
ncbi:MAG: DUF3160 domain-containing protein [Patescibacteria group bacterium]